MAQFKVISEDPLISFFFKSYLHFEFKEKETTEVQVETKGTQETKLADALALLLPTRGKKIKTLFTPVINMREDFSIYPIHPFSSTYLRPSRACAALFLFSKFILPDDVVLSYTPCRVLVLRDCDYPSSPSRDAR